MTQPDYEVVTEGLGFPEGPVVMADGSVILVELGIGRVTRCWGDGRTETVAEPGGGPNGAAIGPDGALYVCNSGGIDLARQGNATGPGSEGRIERIDIATGRVERLYESCDGLALSAPNDLMFAADGSFWFTDLGKVRDNLHEHGGLYHAAADGSAIRRVHHGVVGYNGVGLSPDGATAYVADTFAARLYAFDTAPDAEHGNRRLIGTAPGMVGLDSLAMTAAGNICVARLTPGGIATFTPEGAVSVIPLPDPYTTNIAFGGEDMRTAYITQAATGKLLRMRWAEPGLRLHFNG
jgi:gluconolactonase